MFVGQACAGKAGEGTGLVVGKTVHRHVWVKVVGTVLVDAVPPATIILAPVIRCPCRMFGKPGPAGLVPVPGILIAACLNEAQVLGVTDRFGAQVEGVLGKGMHRQLVVEGLGGLASHREVAGRNPQAYQGGIIRLQPTLGMKIPRMLLDGPLVQHHEHGFVMLAVVLDQEQGQVFVFQQGMSRQRLGQPGEQQDVVILLLHDLVQQALFVGQLRTASWFGTGFRGVIVP